MEKSRNNFGKILKKGLGNYRDELIISTKAGYEMWPGPYGNWGSKKYLVASLDQSLQRMGLDYVDIFYHHRPDPDTPLEETARALDGIVKNGKALYIGISNYNKAQTQTIGQSGFYETKTQSEIFDYCIPIDALYTDPNGRNFVYVLSERSGILGVELVAEQVYVKTLDKNESTVALEGGVIDSDSELIVSSTESLEDGDVVRYKE